jgi:hypothetical protein
LQEFERGLDPQHPQRGKIPARVLGYGEISTVFEIQTEALRGLAFKRLPLFSDEREVERYRIAFEEYNRLLEQEIGIRLPPLTIQEDEVGQVLEILDRMLAWVEEAVNSTR